MEVVAAAPVGAVFVSRTVLDQIYYPLAAIDYFVSAAKKFLQLTLEEAVEIGFPNSSLTYPPVRPYLKSLGWII